MLRLPWKSMPMCTKCCACHAKVAPCAANAAPAMRKQAGPSGDQASATKSHRVKVLRLPRRSTSMPRSLRESKCCACHAKVRPCAANCCTCHAKAAWASGDQAPATKSQRVKVLAQKQPGSSGVQACAGNLQRVKVLHLPRKGCVRDELSVR